MFYEDSLNKLFLYAFRVEIMAINGIKFQIYFNLFHKVFSKLKDLTFLFELFSV